LGIKRDEKKLPRGPYTPQKEKKGVPIEEKKERRNSGVCQGENSKKLHGGPNNRGPMHKQDNNSQRV